MASLSIRINGFQQKRDRIRWLLGTSVILISVMLFLFQRLEPTLESFDAPLFWLLFMALALSLATLFSVSVIGANGKVRNSMFLIVVTCFAFAAMLQIYPQANSSHVVGWDSYYNIRVSNDLVALGKIQSSYYHDSPGHEYVLRWPGFIVLCASSSHLTGVSVLDMARFFPTAIELPSVVYVWVLIRRLRPEAGVLPLGVFPLVFLWQSFAFHSWMVEESLGFPLFLVTLYCGVSYARSGRPAWSALFLLSLLAVTVTHHLSSFMIVLLFLCLFVVLSLMRNGKLNDSGFSRRRVFLLATSSFAVWIYYSATVGTNMMAVLTTTFLSIFSPTLASTGYKGYNVFWDSKAVLVLGFTAAIGALLVINVIRNLRNGRSRFPQWDMAVVGWGGILFLSVLAFSRVFKSSFSPNYGRILTFPWIFVFQSGLERPGGLDKPRTIIVLSFLFCLFNLMTIPPYIYQSDYTLSEGEQYLLNSEENYVLLTGFPVRGVVACDMTVAQTTQGWLRLDTIVMPPIPNATKLRADGVNFMILTDMDAVAPMFPGIEQITPVILHEYETSNLLFRVADSGDMTIYWVA